MHVTFRSVLTSVLLLMMSPAGSWAEDKTEPWVDLIEQVDPQNHTVAGTWTKTETALLTNAKTGSRLTLPWKPVTEYDFEVSFTRKTGVHSIALIFVAGGNQASLDIDGWGQHLAGIQNLAGQSMKSNPTRVPDWILENGKKYTVTLKVRKDRVEALVDGKPLTTYRGNGNDLTLLELWKIPAGTIGIGAWDSETEFHQVRVRAVSGSTKIPQPMPVPVTKTNPPSSPTTKPEPRPSPAGSASQDDIAALSDEFDDPATLKNWQRVFQTEQTQADQLKQYDIGQTQKGFLTMVPHTSTWYRDYRGVLAFKIVEGDFVATTRVRATNRAGTAAPRSTYSLAGIMVRTPRSLTPRTWKPGGENYIFLSRGAARQPGQFAFEVKTTIDSNSQLEVTPTNGPESLIRIARIGSDFVLLRKEGNRSWVVHRRYRRTDMPAKLQVGFTVYTDYATASKIPPIQQNTQVISGGNPDLKAHFDYLRFTRPQVPSDLKGRTYSDPRSITDAELLRFLGD